MNRIDPSKCLIKGNDIWNLAIIDNIDFKEKTFKFSNIYDITRGSFHATLQIAFQIKLLIEAETRSEQIIELTAETNQIKEYQISTQISTDLSDYFL
ncbi:hypothetical protein GLOIN_2v1482460 [Rhizophagus clarus]|uniref:Uncharacterized protein n=1 Tax=Rhizophagus clarus TaxID=94130 RepID=A0A8H3R3E9_9GLOM|nr:hypothetical protein GLOIN_2v1482460 [Rhizophagus clarus]